MPAVNEQSNGNVAWHTLKMNLLDLPDEILLFILEKIPVVDALFRHSGLHNRLHQFLFDPVYVRELDFTMKSWDESISPLNDLVIDRVCKEILPRIHEKIIKLTLEPIAMERVLHAVNYPQVSSLKLMNFTKRTLHQHLTENSHLISLINSQINQLNIHLIDDPDDDNDQSDFFSWILYLSSCLTDLTFHRSIQFEDEKRLIFPLTSINSYALKKLNIQIHTFEECLLLFDGRFPFLSHCSVYISRIFAPSSDINNRTNLSQLKHFSLSSYTGAHVFDDWIVPFLQRMSNLEELQLLLTVHKRDTFRVVDGNVLEQNILIPLSQLKTFHFSIYTSLHQLNNRQVNLNDYPTNEFLQESFRKEKFGQVGSYVHQSFTKTIYGCHVYSLPFQFKTFHRLDSSFTSNIFTHVRTLSINGYASWDYHFFSKVNQSFPFIETLMMYNRLPQKYPNQSNNNFEQFPIITFNRLLVLDVNFLHMDYIRQLLFNRLTHLPRLCLLEIKYEQLITLTNNFTTDPMEFNFFQVQKVITDEHFVRPQNFSQYFPLL